jgi:S1-C subfamily serine protease
MTLPPHGPNRTGGVKIRGVVRDIHGDVVGRNKIGLDEERLLSLLEARGYLQTANAANLQQSTIIELARRVQPDLNSDIDKAFAALEEAVGLAIKQKESTDDSLNQSLFLTKVIAQLGKSTGLIDVHVDGSLTTYATCFVLSSDGYALTAGHVFADNTSYTNRLISVGFSNSPERHPATLLFVDREIDIALIQLVPNKGYIPLNIAFRDPDLGSRVTVIGRDGRSIVVAEIVAMRISRLKVIEGKIVRYSGGDMAMSVPLDRPRFGGPV